MRRAVGLRSREADGYRLPKQRAKDIWMPRIGVDLAGTGRLVRIPTLLIRGPLP